MKRTADRGGTFRRPGRSAGAGLVEVMIGVTIALLAVVMIYRALVVSETLRRDTQASADAQQSALFILSRLSLEISNAGAGFMSAARLLARCPIDPDVASTLRPVSVMIIASASNDAPDALVVRTGTAPGIAHGVSFTDPAPIGAPFTIDAVDGFRIGDRIIAADPSGACASSDVTSVDADGDTIDVSHAAVAAAFSDSATLVNLGAALREFALRFDVSGSVLRTTDMAAGDAPNPLASNVVNLKFQYGIDSDGDGALDTWVSANDAGPLGDWRPAAVLAAPADQLLRVRAIRVGLIVQADYQQRSNRDGFSWVLFDCPAVNKNTCPGRLTGTIAAPASGAWRYRVYETIVPLRNLIWNRS